MYRDTTNVEPQMYDCTNNNWSHWNSNEKLKEHFGSCTGKVFGRFCTKDSYTWNITHNTENTAVWSLKRERRGSPLVQEKYQEEEVYDKRHPYRILIINRVNKPWYWGFTRRKKSIYIKTPVSLQSRFLFYKNSGYHERGSFFLVINQLNAQILVL